MNETGYARKLDSVGRMVIPIKLREQLSMEQGKVYPFFTHKENGRTYLCIECSTEQQDIDRAMAVLEKNGYSVVGPGAAK